MTESRAGFQVEPLAAEEWSKLGAEIDEVVIQLDRAAVVYAGTERQGLYNRAIGFLLRHEVGSPYVAHYCLAGELKVTAGELQKTYLSEQRQHELKVYARALERVLARIRTDINASWGGRLGLRVSEALIGLGV